MVARFAKNAGGGMVAGALLVARVGSLVKEWLLMVEWFPAVKWLFLLECLVEVEWLLVVE